MAEHEFTPDQIMDGIHQAIREQEFTVVPSLIKLLALQDPERAQGVLDTIELGRTLSAAGAGIITEEIG